MQVIKVEQTFERCPHCGSPNIVKKGFETVVPGKKKQRYKCRSCGKTFYLEEET